jgi:hypothetical protein
MSELSSPPITLAVLGLRDCPPPVCPDKQADRQKKISASGNMYQFTFNRLTSYESSIHITFFTLIIQGVPKVPHTFVFMISSKSLEHGKNIGARFKRQDGRFYENHPKNNLTKDKITNLKTKNRPIFHLLA